MKNRWNKSLLMDKAGEGGSGGAGSGGDGTLLGGDSGGGAGKNTQGGEADKPKAGQQGGAPKSGDSGGSSAGGKASDWRSQLPDEIREDAALKVIHDIPGLAKSYLHAQKMIGADKVTIPGKHATPEDWQSVFGKLGLPKELKDYDVKMEEGLSVDKEFIGKFKETAHAAGILPHQAQKLADWFAKTNQESEATVAKEIEAKRKADVDGLKKEWGAAFNQELAKAERALNEIGDKDIIKYLKDTGLNYDINVVKLLNKLANKFMTEDKIEGQGEGGKPLYTPSEAMVEANKIIANFDHPYHKQDHPGHKAAVQEVAELFRMGSLGSKKSS